MAVIGEYPMEKSTNKSGKKSTIDEIRQRFDNDVERFSNLQTGQSATLDAPLAMDLIAAAAARATPHAKAVLDVGCGAGNYTLKLLEKFQAACSVQHGPVPVDVTLIDLSRPMLDRAVQRVSPATSGRVVALQGDIRELPLGAASFDIILAAAVLHHLREEDQWRAVFDKFFAALRPGGSLWIFDMIQHASPHVQALMWERYGQYLAQLKDEAYRDHVFAYIEKEDTPRPLLFQIDLLRAAGFKAPEILHKNGCFAAFGAMKA